MKTKKEPKRLLLATGDGLPEIKRLALEEANKRGWICFNFPERSEGSPEIYKPDMAISMQHPEGRLFQNLLKMGTHCVRIGRIQHHLDSKIPLVLADIDAEGQIAAEHYAERGFRHVGVVVYNRLASYDKTFRDHALKLGCQFHAIDLTKLPESGSLPQDKMFRKHHQLFLSAIAKAPKPIGLLFPGDRLAAEICNFCIMSRINVPEEVAILGRGDDVTICDLSPVRLSSIQPNVEARIAAAFTILDDMLAGRRLPKEPTRISPAGITTRASTDVRASQHPDVTKALRYMWVHYGNPELSVDAIAKEAGFSRRKLERLFRSELNQAVNEALLERRLERCCELLITTDTNATDICAAVGFRAREYLHRAFKRKYGMTMKKYRLKHRQA